MGCDIHLHTEVKIDYDAIIPGRERGEGEKTLPRWEHYSQLHVPRNYDLFARMAGVRNYSRIKCMVDPRGIPEDASGVTLYDWLRAQSDWHTPSWLNAKEIFELAEWCKVHIRADRERAILQHFDLEWECRSYFFGNGYAGFYEYPDERPVGIVDVRFIFWFDN